MQIPWIVRSETAAYALRLNAASYDTARDVRHQRASPSHPLVPGVNGVFGERPLATLTVEVRAALIRELRTTGEELAADLEALPRASRSW